MDYKLSENDIAYFIEYASGKVEAFETIEEREAVVKEIEEDNAAWRAA